MTFTNLQRNKAGHLVLDIFPCKTFCPWFKYNQILSIIFRSIIEFLATKIIRRKKTFTETRF